MSSTVPAPLRAIMIFAKKPAPGTVKTRLVPYLSPEEAASVYTCMQLDTLQTVHSLSGFIPVIFFQDDPGAADYFASLAPETLSLPQKGRDLGQRMQNAFVEVFGRGFIQAIIIGTDSPDLPAEYIYEACTLLEHGHTDVVFGPAEDGGYYLLGLKRVWDELFSGLPWSCDTLLSASVERAKDLCLGVSFLPEWHDIDTASDLQRPELFVRNSPAVRTAEFITSTLQPNSQPFSNS